MTLIEIFDTNPTENIISTLALKPKKLVYLTTEPKKTARAAAVYSKLFDERHICCDIKSMSVSKNDLSSINTVIEGIISDPNETYVVDISGGEGSIMFSLGLYLGALSKKFTSLYTFRINIFSRHGILTKLSSGDEYGIVFEKDVYDLSYKTQVYLSLEENILLHGGEIFEHGQIFTLDDKRLSDVDSMWDICRRDCAGWNIQIGRFSSIISKFSDSEKLYAFPENRLGDGRDRFKRSLWESLLSEKLIVPEKYGSSRGITVFSFKNSLVRECLTKAGSVLEYHTYKTALEAEENGEPVFDSAISGVVIGWGENGGKTKNEIDCVLSHGLVPIFISCKNGDVKTDELYKLSSVADHFGGNYTKKALVSTVFFDRQSKAYPGDKAVSNLRERADSMGIRLISEVHRLTRAQLKKELLKMV